MYLAIDPITSLSGITLIDGEQKIFKPIDRFQISEKLISTIKKLFQEINRSPKDLKAIGIINGPGSFTGLRVGIAVANQFVHQLKIPFFKVTTDQFFLNQSDEKDLLYVQSLNRDEVYVSGIGACKMESKVILLDHLLDQTKEPFNWIGMTSEIHNRKLNQELKIKNLKSTTATWNKIFQNKAYKNSDSKLLIEPFYGKKPNITPSKKKLV